MSKSHIARWVIFALVATFALMAIGVYGFGGFSRNTAEYRGETKKQNQVEANADYRIAAYDHFYDLCAAIETKADKIAAQEKLLDTTTDPDRKAQIRANLAALQGTKAELVNQYNADAAKGYTQGQFRASELPYHINENAKEIKCGSPQDSQQ